MNKEKIQWREEMATLIDAWLEKCEPSDDFIHISPDERFFDDSCSFVELTHQLRELVATFRNLNRYSEIISVKSANEENG